MKDVKTWNDLANEVTKLVVDKDRLEEALVKIVLREEHPCNYCDKEDNCRKIERPCGQFNFKYPEKG
jgi:hypothetical protein